MPEHLEQLKMQVLNQDGLIIAKYSGTLMQRNEKSANRFQGHLMRWHNPDRLDLTGEWFSRNTNRMIKAGYPIVGIPTNFQHGLYKDANTGREFGAMGIGLLDFTDEDEIGQFVEGVLFEREQYLEMLREIGRTKGLKVSDSQYNQKAELAVKAVNTLLAKAPMQFSGGYDPVTWVVNPDTKHIDQAGAIHLAFTPTPADDLNPIVSFKSMMNAALDLEHERKTYDMSPNSIQTDTQPTAHKEVYPKDANGSKLDVVDSTKENLPLTNSEESTKEERMNPQEFLAELLAKLQAYFAGEQAMPENEAVAMATEVTDELKQEFPPEEEAKAMTDEEVTKTVGKAFDIARRKLEAKMAQKAKLASAFNSGANALKTSYPSQAAFQSGFTQTPRISVGEERKFAHLSASDMALAMVLTAAPAKSQGIPFRMGDNFSESFIKTFAHKAFKHAESEPYGKNAKSFGQLDSAIRANNHIKSITPFKANELNASDITGQGLEWVSEWWSTDLWERERFERHYDALVQRGMMVQTIPQGADSAHFPTEGSDPVAYAAPQANSVGADGRPESTVNFSPYLTGEVTCTPGEIKIATSQTVILEEDSIINVVQNVNRQLNEAAMETRDKLLVNGDSTVASANINYDGALVPTGLQKPYYTVANGFRYHGLVNNSRDASNVLNLEQYRLTLAELDPELRQYYERMVFFIDPTTEIASLAMPEIATDDVRRTNATVTSGRLINIYGVDVRVNGFIPQTDTDGKVTATGNVANRGTILLIYAPYWGFAYKRQVTLETARNIYSGTNDYVMSMRIGMVARGTNATALTYNVATAVS